MQKIVISSNTSWSIYNFRLNLAREIKNKGYEVIIVSPYDEYSERIKKEFKYYDIYMNNKGTNPLQDIKTMIKYYKLYKKIKPEFVLNFTIKPNIYGTIVCSFLNIKSINNIAGLGNLFVNQNFITKIAKLLYKYSQNKANTIFFQNRDDYEMFTKEKIVNKDKCDILPGSGVDLEKFKPLNINKDNNELKFLLVSRMIWDKGIKEYIEAIRIIKQKYKDVEFYLLGALGVDNPTAISKDEIYQWETEKLIKYLGTSDNIQNEIAKVDCIVLPSFYREGTPRILLEAAAMAKPIITTDNVGCRDVVEDEINGYLCEIKNGKDLANKIEKMINLSEKQRIEMGKKGREKIIKKYDEKIVINKYLEVIKNIL